MGLLLQQLFALLKLLNSDHGTKQIAWGIALGLVLGFSPLLSLQTLVVVVILFFFRIQIGAATLAAFFFKLIAYVVDPLADLLGQWALELPQLKPLYTQAYNMPIVPFTRFNNSIVMGSGILAFALAPLVYLASKVLIERYRIHIVARFKQSRAFKLLSATSLYQWYVKYEQIRG